MDGSDRAGDVHPRMMRGRAFRLTLALAAVASLAAGVATSSQGSPARCSSRHAERSGHTAGRAPRSAGNRAAPEHRLHPHRRPVDGPAALHAARAGDATRRADVQQLLRLGLAVLSVALFDLHGQLPARHRRVQQRRPARRLPRVLRPRRGAAHVRGGAAERRLSHGDDGQVPQRLRSAEGQRSGAAVHVRPAGLVGVGRRRMGLSGVQLQPEQQRRDAAVRQPAEGLSDRRPGTQGRRLHQHLGGDRPAVLPRARDRSRRTFHTRPLRATSTTSRGCRLPGPPTSTSSRPIRPGGWLTTSRSTRRRSNRSTRCIGVALSPCRPSTR